MKIKGKTMMFCTLQEALKIILPSLARLRGEVYKLTKECH